MPVGPALVKNGLAVGIPIDPENAPGVRCIFTYSCTLTNLQC